ncbi:MAG: reductive dehalogenase [Dehalogenimonas sp.]|uniref:Reductive dehalogenase n=1 Tax=Candidatus Dehalogenimonas loeffleri TaxID=3127115 RepID=A0ABZ2J9I1_9CHLR|nr:reductive dehalogenase [Dehalogenimonas sp.]
MSKFHSTISRRDFMKALGITGAGLGAASLLSPQFQDLDDMISASASQNQYPWWVRRVDEPTVEVDWTMKSRWSEVNTLRGSSFYMNSYITPEEQNARQAQQAAWHQQWLEENKPGWALRDRAFSGAADEGGVSNTFMGTKRVAGPEDLGVPKYSGTPEENSRLIRSALRFFGCMSVGFVELDPLTTEKFIYSYEPGGRRQITWKADGPFETATEHAHPLDARNVIVMVNQENHELWKRSNTLLQVQIRYQRAANIQERVQNFLGGLGYWALSEGGNGTGNAPALSIMAGLGELGRIQRTITPEWGPTVGIFRYITDMPVEAGKPIDAGFWRFCFTCKKCAEACGEGALSLADEPTWDPSENATPYTPVTGHDPADRPGALPAQPGGWHQGGAKVFYEDSRKCRAWKMHANTCNSGRCHGVCTFTKHHYASIHETVLAVQSATPIFNSFFKEMDDLMGYGLAGWAHDDYSAPDDKRTSAVDEFWNYQLPVYGIDTSVGQSYQ